jgi:hypothetical protein
MKPRRMLPLLWVLAACGYESVVGEFPASDGGSGTDAGPEPDAGLPAECREHPSASPLRTLTARELEATLTDATGVAVALDLADGGTFAGSYSAGFPMTALAFESIGAAASSIATELTSDDGTRFGCPGWDQACAADRLIEITERLYRRPLSSAERSGLVRSIETPPADAGIDEVVQLALATVLVAPDTLHHIELGDRTREHSRGIPLGDFELASRLSYRLRGSIPDPPLWAAAASGALRDSAEVERQAARLLADDAGLDAFHREWLGIDPPISSPYAESFVDETLIFAREVVHSSGTLTDLYASSYSYLDGPLEEFYLDRTPTFATFTRTDLPTDRFASVLTHGSLLANRAPTVRGMRIRERMLCQAVPAPPPGVPIGPIDPAPGATYREQLAALVEDSACRACHALTDPAGFAFERFDREGRPRETDNGLPIDDSWELDGVTGAGAPAFAQALANDRNARECYVTQWFQYLVRRPAVTADRCTLNHANQHFDEAGRVLEQAVRGLVLTEGFTSRESYDAGAAPAEGDLDPFSGTDYLLQRAERLRVQSPAADRAVLALYEDVVSTR